MISHLFLIRDYLAEKGRKNIKFLLQLEWPSDISVFMEILLFNLRVAPMAKWSKVLQFNRC